MLYLEEEGAFKREGRRGEGEESIEESVSLACLIRGGGVSLLFGSAELLRSPRAFLPEVCRDGEGVHTHGHGFGRDGGEQLAVGAVLEDGLHHLGVDDARPDAGEPHHLLRLGIHGVHRPELAAGVPEQDEEVVGVALFHFLECVKREQLHVSGTVNMQRSR